MCVIKYHVATVECAAFSHFSTHTQSRELTVPDQPAVADWRSSAHNKRAAQVCKESPFVKILNLISPPNGFIPHSFDPSLARIHLLTTPSCKFPTDLPKSPNLIRWAFGETGETEIEGRRRKRGWKNPSLPSRTNLAEIQKRKSFPHFTGRQQTARGKRERPVPTAQSFKTNETLCVSRADGGPAQIRHVHHGLRALSLRLWHRSCVEQNWVISASLSPLPPAPALQGTECL